MKDAILGCIRCLRTCSEFRVISFAIDDASDESNLCKKVIKHFLQTASLPDLMKGPR